MIARILLVRNITLDYNILHLWLYSVLTFPGFRPRDNKWNCLETYIDDVSRV